MPTIDPTPNGDAFAVTFQDTRLRARIHDGDLVVNAADVTRILGLPDSAAHDLPDRHRVAVDGGTSPADRVFVTGRGVNRLAMLADTPEAEDFQEWLAAIAGSVSRSGPTTPLDLSTTPTEILELVSGLGKAVHEAAQQALATRSEAEEQRPAAHAWRVLASTDGDYSVREAAYILNRDPAISTGQRRLFAFVRASGMVSADTDIPRTRHERHLRLRPTSYAHPHTGRRVPGKPQLRVTVEGLRYLHRRLGGTARLDLPEAEDIRTAQTMPPLARTT